MHNPYLFATQGQPKSRNRFLSTRGAENPRSRRYRPIDAFSGAFQEATSRLTDYRIAFELIGRRTLLDRTIRLSVCVCYKTVGNKTFNSEEGATVLSRSTLSKVEGLGQRLMA